MNKYHLDCSPNLGARTTSLALGDPEHYVPGVLIYENQEETGDITNYLYLKPEEVGELSSCLLQAYHEIVKRTAH